MKALPTIWYCPRCGHASHLTLYVHSLTNPERDPNCEGTAIEVPIIRPGLPPDELLAALRAAGLDAQRADCDYEGWLPRERGEDILILELGGWGT